MGHHHAALNQKASVALKLAAAAGLGALVLSFGAPARSGPPQAAAAILVLTALAVGLEQLSAYGLDNLSVPLVVGLLWSLLRP